MIANINTLSIAALVTASLGAALCIIALIGEHLERKRKRERQS